MKRLIKKSNMNVSEKVNIVTKNKKLDGNQINEIRKGFNAGLTVEQMEVCAKEEFNSEQIKQLISGFQNKLNIEEVMLFADPELNHKQMKQIRMALEKGISLKNINLMSDVKFNDKQMEILREAFELGLPYETVVEIADENFTNDQMKQKRDDFLKGFDNQEVKIIEKLRSEGHIFYENLTHDEYNRNAALVYIDGKFYKENKHNECIRKNKEERNEDAKLKNTTFRPDEYYMEDNYKDDVYFFANIVEEEKDGTNNEKCIYIVTIPYTMKGITLDEAVKICKQHYPDYKVYNDDTGKINKEKGLVDYVRLAKTIGLKKKLIKKAFDTTLYHVTDWQGFIGILRDGVIYAFAPANAGIKDIREYGKDRLEEGSKRNRYKDELMEGKLDGYVTKKDVDNYLGRVFLTNKQHLKDKSTVYGKVAIKLRLPEDALLPDNNDYGSAKNAAQSLGYVGQASIMGDITDNYFDSFLFFNQYGDTILEKPYSKKTTEIKDFFTDEDIYAMLIGGEYTIDDFLNYGVDISEELKNNSDTIKLINKSPLYIQYLKNPSELLQLSVVKKSGNIIELINNPTEKVKIEAVKNNGPAIRFIEDPSEDVQIQAVKQYGASIKFIKNPCIQAQIEAINDSCINIELIKDPSKEVQLYAVKKDPKCIEYIKNPDEETQWYVITENVDNFHYIQNPSNEIKEYYELMK